MGPNYIYLDGTYYDSNEAVLSLRNRAFRYGDGLFETIRVVNGSTCFLGEHLDRLSRGMGLLKMQGSMGLTLPVIEPVINALIQKNNIVEGGRIRLAVFRKDGGYYTPSTNEVSVSIEAVHHKHNQFELNKDGLSVGLFDQNRITINAFSGIKSSNSLTYVMAGVHRKEVDWDDCLLVNELGQLCESISSNVFVVYNGVLYTPSLTQGCIDGIMRGQVIDLARKCGYEVQECPLSPEALMRGDEVFLTNAIEGIRWVKAYRSKRYFNKVSKTLVEKLNERVANLAMGLLEN